MKYIPELVLDSKCKLGEGPLWDIKEKRLYFIDILGNKICRFDPKENSVDEMDCKKNVGTIAFSKSHQLIAAFKDGFYHVDFDKKKYEFICDPEKDKPDNRFNDGKAAPGGHFIAGSICMDWDKGCGTNEPKASLYCMNKDLSVSVIDEDIVISNGIAWTADEKTMYFADTARFAIYSYDYDKKIGMASNKKIIINVPEYKGYPDGMTIDTEGMLWVCHWGGSAVNRWNPQTGELIESIQMPVSLPTCCTFGGDNMDELYITSASVGMENERYAGGIFKVKMDVKGNAPFVFGE